MRILALDLGTATGFALEADNYPLSCGTIHLATSEEIAGQARLGYDRRLDVRFTRLLTHIHGLYLCYGLDLIVFEDVQFASTSQQAHLWATWRAAVWAVAHGNHIPVNCCPTGTLKKFATGKGNALKPDMARYLCQNPRFELLPAKVGKRGKMKGKGLPQTEVRDKVTGSTLDDNAIDALHLLRWAKEKHT